MRAVLLATATATTFAGLRANSCVCQGYFTGWARACLITANAPTTRMRRRYRSPCLEMVLAAACRRSNPRARRCRSRPQSRALFEDRSIRHRRHNGIRAEDTDAWNALEPFAVLAFAMLRK